MNVVDLTLQQNDDRWPAVMSETDGIALPGLEQLKAARGGTEISGVQISTEETVFDLTPVLHRLEFVAIVFPVFTDGRGFSMARRLIEEFGFAGELRAIGHVLPDQALFLRRTGFDTAEFADSGRADEARRALRQFSVWYQPAIDGSRAIHAMRLVRPAAE